MQLSNLTVEQKKTAIKDVIVPRKGSPKKVPPELVKHVEALKNYARTLNRENSNKMTTCLKCDRPGYAWYKVRSSNYKLILSYVHKNEPPITVKDRVSSDGRKFQSRSYRQCWIGNIVTESQVLEKVRKSEQKPEPRIRSKDRHRKYRVNISLGQELTARINELRGRKPFSQYAREMLEMAVLGEPEN